VELRHPRPPGVTAPPARAQSDSALQRALWAALRQAGRLTGPRLARAVAAAVMRAAARTPRGYTKGLYRVARRHPVPMPDLFMLPDEWWTTAPRVRARRLGLDLELDLRDNLQRTLYFTGTYEPGLVRLLENELEPADVLIDVGAHVGVHALGAARRLRELSAGGRVIAFEPTSDSAAAIRAAAARNGLDVEVVEAALGDHEGTVELFADPRYGGHDAGVRSQFGEGEVVQQAPLTTLDAWAAATGLERLDVVKLDIEGAEILALRGAQETLRRLRPRLIAIEVKDVVMERGPGDEAALHALLAGCGYAPAGEAERHIAVFRPAS
jgi:FkbM family methyltransferase